MPWLQPQWSLTINGVDVVENKLYTIHWKSTSGGYKKRLGKVSKIIPSENCILFDMSKDFHSATEKIYLDEGHGIFDISAL